MQTYLNSFCVDHVEDRQGVIIVHTSGEVKLKIEVINEGTLKVGIYRSGSLKEPHSYSIEQKPTPVNSYETSEDIDNFQLITKQMIMTIQKQGIRISYHKPDGTLLTQENGERGFFWEEDGPIGFSHEMKPDEHFYGLGEDNDAYLGHMDRRGSKRDMITEQRINVGHVTADIPISFFMSTDEALNSYGIFCDTSYLMNYDMGKDRDDCYTFEAAGGDLIYYFFAQEDFKGILYAYTNLTGKPLLLPRWTLGFIQSYCCYRTWTEMEDVIRQNEQHQIPLDCMVIDFDWSKSTHNFEWDDSWEGLSHDKIIEYRKQGLEFMISNCGPMLKKDSINMQEAIDAGIMARDYDSNLITCGHYGGILMDFSHPNIKNWLRPHLRAILDDGLAGWWLDLTEPEGDIEETLYHDGPRSQIHNVYSLLNSKVYYEITKEYETDVRPFILTRTGTAGIQKYGNAIWTGDVFSDYQTFQAHCPEALNTTLSGIPNWTFDSGGFISSTYAGNDNVQLYNNDPGAHALLYERWLQFACFSPITRAHHVGPSAPYMFQDLILASNRHYLQLRQRLLPYIYSYSYECERTGMSIMRPLIYEYQNDKQVYNLKDEYLFGRELLIAPVLTEKTMTKKVYFPAGTWMDWDYGDVYEGKHSYEVYAPQNRIPVFLKKGAILPMLKKNYRNGKEAELEKLMIRVYPDIDSTFQLYHDDGETCSYQNGEYTLTQIRAFNFPGVSLDLNTEADKAGYEPKEIIYEILVDYAPKAICINGIQAKIYEWKTQLDDAAEGAYFDYFQKKVFVKLQVQGLRSSVHMDYASETPLARIIKGQREQSGGQLPYLYPPATLPCRIQAENYDRGGEGIAYHIQHPVENGLFRKDAVEISKSDDVTKGYIVRNLGQGDWLEYTVHVSKNDKYYVKVRARGLEEKNHFTIDVNTQTMSGLLQINASEEFQSIETREVFLSEGDQVIRIFVKQGIIDLNWFEILKK